MKIQSYNKYGNHKTTIDNITFASKKEATRYSELKLLHRAGEIMDLKLQLPFKLYAGIVYVADFVYWDKKRPDLKMIVEDVKGVKTEVYRLKKKLLLDKYKNIDFREI